jgi:two-component system response regulator RstA
VARTVGEPATGAHPHDRLRVAPTDPRPLRLPPTMRVGPFEVDLLRRTARLGPEVYILNGATLRLLCLLAANAGRVLTRAEIWGALSVSGVFPSSNAVDAMVAQLRRRLRDDAAHPRLVETVPGRGYRLLAST